MCVSVYVCVCSLNSLVWFAIFFRWGGGEARAGADRDGFLVSWVFGKGGDEIWEVSSDCFALFQMLGMLV